MGKIANMPHHHPLTDRSLKMAKAIGTPNSNKWSTTQKQSEGHEWQSAIWQDKSNIYSDKLQLQLGRSIGTPRLI